MFVMFINDLPEVIEGFCKLYADDSKIIRVIEDDSSADILQRDIDSVTNWTKEWLMKLNSSKCKVMHFGNKNARSDYFIDDLSTGQRINLEVSECERDLGIFVSSDLKWNIHVSNIASKANKVLGMLVKNFTCRDVDLWKQLYISLVRPHLEFASSVWNPYRQGDISILEKVQRRASKIPTRLKNLPYEERLKIWGITSLEERRTRGDLIQTYKTVNGIESIDWYSGLQFVSDSRTRAATSHSKRLKREVFPSRACNDFCHFVNVRHEFFLNRVTGYWNELTKSHVNAKNINSFKAGLDSLPTLAAKAYQAQ